MVKGIRSENSGDCKSLSHFMHLKYCLSQYKDLHCYFEKVFQSRKCKSKITSVKISALEPDRLPVILQLAGPTRINQDELAQDESTSVAPHG